MRFALQEMVRDRLDDECLYTSCVLAYRPRALYNATETFVAPRCGQRRIIKDYAMQIPVLIESVPGNGYRARGGEPFALVGEGATPEDALAQFKSCVSAKLRDGARIAAVEIQPADHAWLPFAGMYQETDPIVRDWLDTVRQERESAEASE